MGDGIKFIDAKEGVSSQVIKGKIYIVKTKEGRSVKIVHSNARHVKGRYELSLTRSKGRTINIDMDEEMLELLFSCIGNYMGDKISENLLSKLED